MPKPKHIKHSKTHRNNTRRSFPDLDAISSIVRKSKNRSHRRTSSVAAVAASGPRIATDKISSRRDGRVPRPDATKTGRYTRLGCDIQECRRKFEVRPKYAGSEESVSDARVQASKKNVLGRSGSRVQATQPDPQDIFPRRLDTREESGASPKHIRIREARTICEGVLARH